MKKLLALAALATLPVLATAGPGDWVYAGAVDGPAPSTSRITADSNGTIYVATGSSGAPDETVWKSTDFVASVTADPMVAPSWSSILADGTQENGFQGLVCDSSDNLYVVGDELSTPGRVDKIDSAGNPVAAFGTNGTVEPSSRVVGGALMSDGSLIASYFGGTFYQFDGTNGDELTTFTTNLLAPGDSTNFPGSHGRDLAVKPDSVGGNDIIYLNRSGNLLKITGGSTSNTAGYTTVTNISPVDCDVFGDNGGANWDVKAGAYYFAADDTVMFTNFTEQPDLGVTNPGVVYVINAADDTLAQEVTGPNGYSSVSDVVAFSAGAIDIMVVVDTMNTGMYIFTKNNGSSVEDWQLF